MKSHLGHMEEEEEENGIYKIAVQSGDDQLASEGLTCTNMHTADPAATTKNREARLHLQ